MDGVRRLGPLAATVLVAGNMIGSGVFLLPATLGTVGSISLISWGVASAGALTLALVFGLLGVLRPASDGAVAYAAEALHPALGHLGWFAYWLNCWVGTTAIAVAAVGYLAFFLPVLKETAPATVATLAAIWLMTFANLAGPRVVARLGGATLALGLLPILVAVGVGLFAFKSQVFMASWNVSGRPDGAAAAAAVVPVFWAFLGLESANVAASVIDNPRRNLPIAAVGGVALAAGVYIAATGALMGLYPARDLAASSAPFADALKGIVGPVAAALVAACACAKATGTLGGWVLLTAETGRSGAAAGFLPKVMSEVRADRLPRRDLLAAGLLMSLATLASVSPTLGGQFAALINVSVILSMALYLLCALSLVRLSREFERPALRWTAVAAALAASTFSLWVILTMEAALRPLALAAAAASLALWGFSRWRSPRGSAPRRR